MATSRVPEIIDNLLAALAAAPPLAHPVRVYDGPLISGEQPADSVFIGYDGDPEGEFQAAAAEQSWAGLGARAKDETVQIVGAVIARRGDTNVRKARVRGYQLLAAVEDALRASPALGMPPPTTVAMAAGTCFQEQHARGVQCRITFSIAVETRI
ncbi:hypothetical protein [Nonomuraea dietziae]|uniref:hypothetical protein n=1 Tax=Nonomuraea dietziae TaxID=65515 RepID=UPI00344AA82A